MCSRKSAYLNQPSSARLPAMPAISQRRAAVARPARASRRMRWPSDVVGGDRAKQQRHEARVPPAVEEQAGSQQPRERPGAAGEAAEQEAARQADRQEAQDECLRMEQHGARLRPVSGREVNKTSPAGSLGCRGGDPVPRHKVLTGCRRSSFRSHDPKPPSPAMTRKVTVNGPWYQAVIYGDGGPQAGICSKAWFTCTASTSRLTMVPPSRCREACTRVISSS